MITMTDLHSATHSPSTTLRNAALRRVTWHRPLLVVSLAMAALAVWSFVGIFVDPRIITGAALWAKPFKFAVSVFVYSLSLSWLIGLVKGSRRVQRVAWWAGTTAAVFLAVEIVIIVAAAAADTTSHFNVSTPLQTAVWAVMAVSIVVVWSAAVPVAVLLFRSDLGDAARTLAIRSGLIIALIGMGLAFLMTSPTAAQLADYHGIVGAHTVGLPDGGPGLPLLGWSTVGGDLRIPHFVGMHALQIIPLIAAALELLSTRIRALLSPGTRLAVMRVVVVAYLATLVFVTWEALAGIPLIRL
ncbi:hypothetical protein KPL76_02100 [Subtercola sp. PAMC28395]|uniref:hypothetical protein n=1 Tax=Subtercola sp. PAMC28395 TaxID=2846775 RepID=UPI001C0BAB5E|nr:hypothetical protein [Subtercola sp. PAMC28395]QWT24240.1 hypothetical protein KPL76_02100 [Subtercola sp. PAMC28395]